MGENRFKDDREKIRKALARALRVEAEVRGLRPDEGLFRRVADAFDGQNDSPPPPPPRRDWLAPLFGGEPPLALVVFGTPSIQDYLFKVASPIDLFGGSRQVADFTLPDGAPSVSIYHRLAAKPAALPVDLVTIFAGGGAGLLLVAASEATATIAAIESILREATAGDLHSFATSLAVWPDEILARESDSALGELLFAGDSRPASEQPKAPSAYAATLGCVLRQLHRRRSRRQPWPEALEAEAQFTCCEACGGRPARQDRQRGADLERLCDPCYRRWRFGQARRQDREEPRSFEDLLAGLEPPVDSLAVIYADGANAGDLFARLDTPARHRALSRAIEEALTAGAAAVESELRRIYDTSGDELRFQTAIQGGDDLVMVVPSRGALEIVKVLVDAFERSIDAVASSDAFTNAPRSLRDALGKFGLGVGLAVGGIHFPIQFQLAYARELLKSAKTRTRGTLENGGKRSAVDFLILRGGTPLSGSISDLRKRHLQRDEDQLTFHTRPFSSEELGGFLDAAKALRQVPPAQVQAIRRELPRGRRLSLSLWRYQQARSAEWAAWRTRLKVASLGDVDAKLWRRKGERWVTDFLDQVDVLDLLSTPSAEARND